VASRLDELLPAGGAAGDWQMSSAPVQPRKLLSRHAATTDLHARRS